jgi:hypothetical protein
LAYRWVKFNNVELDKFTTVFALDAVEPFNDCSCISPLVGKCHVELAY